MIHKLEDDNNFIPTYVCSDEHRIRVCVLIIWSNEQILDFVKSISPNIDWKLRLGENPGDILCYPCEGNDKFMHITLDR